MKIVTKYMVISIVVSKELILIILMILIFLQLYILKYRKKNMFNNHIISYNLIHKFN